MSTDDFDEDARDRAFDGDKLPARVKDERAIKMEKEVWSPARRVARIVGRVAGKGAAIIAIFFGVVMLALGAGLLAVDFWIIQVVAWILLSMGGLSFGGGVLGFRAIRRANARLSDLEVEHHVMKMLTLQGELTARDAASALRQPVKRVEDIAAGLERRGELERDVDMTAGGVEVYRPAGWRDRQLGYDP